MRAQMHSNTFNNPIGICIVINVSIMAIYELSNDLNHIKMH